MERRARSKLGRKAWREQDRGSDEGLRSEREGKRKVLELMQEKGFMLREWEWPGKRRDREGKKHSLCPAAAGWPWMGCRDGGMRGPAIKRSPQPK